MPNDNVQLFKASPPPTGLTIEPTPEALALQDTLITDALSIDSVPRTPDENERCAEVGGNIQRLIKNTKKDGLALRRPYNAEADKIKRVEDNYLNPLRPHLKRLGGFSAVWRSEQERLAEIERRRRAEEIARLEEQERKAVDDVRKASEAGDLAGALLGDLIATAAGMATTLAIAAPPPEAPKTPGQAFQERVLGWECTDPIALWNARPDLCNPPTPKPSAIKATCAPERPVSGLKLWWEAKVNFKSR